MVEGNLTPFQDIVALPSWGGVADSTCIYVYINLCWQCSWHVRKGDATDIHHTSQYGWSTSLFLQLEKLRPREDVTYRALTQLVNDRTVTRIQISSESIIVLWTEQRIDLEWKDLVWNTISVCYLRQDTESAWAFSTSRNQWGWTRRSLTALYIRPMIYFLSPLLSVVPGGLQGFFQTFFFNHLTKVGDYIYSWPQTSQTAVVSRLTLQSYLSCSSLLRYPGPSLGCSWQCFYIYLALFFSGTQGTLQNLTAIFIVLHPLEESRPFLPS